TEKAAARAYGAESGFFHLAVQCDHSLALKEWSPYHAFLGSGKLLALRRAASKYELTGERTVYSGHANGFGIIGSLGDSDAALFVGLTWTYRGFTSTTADRAAAIRFLAGAVRAT